MTLTAVALVIAALCAAACAGFAVAWWQGRIATARLTAATRRMARGELAPPDGSAAPAVGELGRLEVALDDLRERLRARDDEVAALTAAATGEALAELVEELDRLTDGIGASVRTTSSGIASTVTSIEQVTRGGEAVLRAVEDASATMETVAASVTSVAATAESLSQVAQQVASEAAAGGQLLGDSAEKLALAADRAQQSEAAIERLTHRSKEIGTIVKVIESLADQSNLLALNAAIEAARAGDAGRGFAVVADEVRKLAERSMAATQEIGEVIGAAQQDNDAVVKAARSILSDIHDGARQVTHTSRGLGTILMSIEQVTAQVSDVQKATQEQSFAANEVMKLVANMNDVARRVVSATGEQSAASTGVVAAVRAIEASLVEVAAVLARGRPAAGAGRKARQRGVTQEDPRWSVGSPRIPTPTATASPPRCCARWATPTARRAAAPSSNPPTTSIPKSWSARSPIPPTPSAATPPWTRWPAPAAAACPRWSAPSTTTTTSW